VTKPLQVGLVGDYSSAVTAHRAIPRAVELAGHPFYLGTACQPERSALAGQPHPLIVAFVGALSQ
jgi:CTP synthase (UTP-ammonia lyase)